MKQLRLWVCIPVPAVGACAALWFELLFLPSSPSASPDLCAAPASVLHSGSLLFDQPAPDAHWWNINLHIYINATKKKWNLKSNKRLTSSFARARPEESGAGLSGSSETNLWKSDPILAKWLKVERSPSGGFSWLHVGAYAGSSLVHTAEDGGASSCGGCFARWRGPNGLDL